MKHIVGQPGGPNGPFYSVVREDGRVIAMQIPSEKTAHVIARMLNDRTPLDFRDIYEALNNQFIKDNALGSQKVLRLLLATGESDYFFRQYDAIVQGIE